MPVSEYLSKAACIRSEDFTAQRKRQPSQAAFLLLLETVRYCAAGLWCTGGFFVVVGAALAFSS